MEMSSLGLVRITQNGNSMNQVLQALVPGIFWVAAGLVLLILIMLLGLHTCFFWHKGKRYLSINRNGTEVSACHCACWEDEEDIDHHCNTHRYYLRWVCDRCEGMGEGCWRKSGAWKIEHGHMVPDEKQWAQGL